MLNLLLKDFKLMLGSKQSLSQRIISAFFAALFFGAVIVVEVFLFRTILNTIGNIKGATSAFLTVFLCVTTVIITVSDLFNAKRLFFDDKDIEQLSPRPVTNGQIILSKMLFLFLIHYFTSILFEYPVLFAYDEMIGKPPLYFFTALFYPVATFLFEAGIALLLVYPLWLLSNLLKKTLFGKIYRVVCGDSRSFFCVFLRFGRVYQTRFQKRAYSAFLEGFYRKNDRFQKIRFPRKLFDRYIRQ